MALNEKESVLFPKERGVIPRYAGELYPHFKSEIKPEYDPCNFKGTSQDESINVEIRFIARPSMPKKLDSSTGQLFSKKKFFSSK